MAEFLRVGQTGQKKLEALHAAGRFPFCRVVFDAVHMREQLGLLERLKANGCEVVLDPSFAEMAIEGRSQSNDGTRRLVDDGRKRLALLRDALDDLESREGIETRSPTTAFRGAGGAVAAMLGR